MNTFVKSTELKLVNGGYLVIGKENIPVNHPEFAVAQKHAEYIIAFAKAAEGKDFKGKKADSLEELKALVTSSLYEKKTIEFVAKPKKVTKPLQDKLAKEALAFMDFGKEEDKVDKINTFLSRFEIIHEFEEFGLYFEQSITKLNNIYTMAEITKAVTDTIGLLD